MRKIISDNVARFYWINANPTICDRSPSVKSTTVLFPHRLYNHYMLIGDNRRLPSKLFHPYSMLATKRGKGGGHKFRIELRLTSHRFTNTLITELLISREDKINAFGVIPFINRLWQTWKKGAPQFGWFILIIRFFFFTDFLFHQHRFSSAVTKSKYKLTNAFVKKNSKVWQGCQF